MNYTAVRAELKKLDGTRPPRVFVVYREVVTVGSGQSKATGFEYRYNSRVWRWRLVATSNWSITGGSQQDFADRGKAFRAAKRESSYYREGQAAVVVLND